MTQEQTQWHWLDTRETVTLYELSDCCGMTVAELDELVDYCALQPATPDSNEPAGRVFSAQWVMPLRLEGVHARSTAGWKVAKHSTLNRAR